MAGGLALLVALSEESRGILKAGCWSKIASSRLQAMYERRVGSEETVLAVSGVGRSHAEAATRAVLEERRPKAVLSLGFAGGLSDGQRAGDLVVANVLIPAGSVSNDGPKPCVSEALDADHALKNKALGVLATLGLRYRVGACVTASQPVSRPEAKRRLGLDASALAVEMESFWIALSCHERNVPFLAVRAIVDTAERPLPDFIADSALDARAGSRWRGVLSVMLRPHRIPSLIQLGGAASQARNSLSLFASGFLRDWPCPASE